MQRSLLPYIQKDLERKVVLVTGPRQAGKTTLAKQLSSSYDYLNFDSAEHRLLILEKSWDRKKDLVIFDELHKMKKWKIWLKGVYDTEGIPPKLLVTGSARLDLAKKTGDSLAGRFFEFRLHPLDLKEIHQHLTPDHLQDSFQCLLNVGGFPEPYLEGTPEFYGRWKRSHLDIILKQDMIEIEHIREITSIETLIQLLRKQVGSLVSYSSLARDLQVNDKTVKRWLTSLENLYIVFKVPPYHRNIARAIQKSPKYYFYDTGQVMGDTGAKLENAVACALLKEIHFRQDCFGEERALRLLRDKEGREVDFLVVKNDEPSLLVEAKWSEQNWSPALRYWQKRFSSVPAIQVVGQLEREKTFGRLSELRAAAPWLAALDLP